jgi:outer membrane protein TolC
VVLGALAAGAPAAATANDSKGPKLQGLLKERVAILRDLVKATIADYRTGKISFDRLHQARKTLLHAELELCESDKERIALLEKMVTLAKEQEESASQLYRTGAVPHSDVLMAAADRLDAEIALERARSKAASPPK